MAQAEIYKILKKNPHKWFTSNQLAKKIGISTGSVNTSLRKLFQQGLIRSKTCKDESRRIEYQYFK